MFRENKYVYAVIRLSTYQLYNVIEVCWGANKQCSWCIPEHGKSYGINVKVDLMAVVMAIV